MAEQQKVKRFDKGYVVVQVSSGDDAPYKEELFGDLEKAKARAEELAGRAIGAYVREVGPTFIYIGAPRYAI